MALCLTAKELLSSLMRRETAGQRYPGLPSTSCPGQSRPHLSQQAEAHTLPSVHVMPFTTHKVSGRGPGATAQENL